MSVCVSVYACKRVCVCAVRSMRVCVCEGCLHVCVCVRVLCHKTKRPGNTMLTQTRTHMTCAHIIQEQ